MLSCLTENLLNSAHGSRGGLQSEVRTLGEHLVQLKQGDLTAEVQADSPGSYAELKTNFNEALSSLRDLIGTVMESAAGIARS